MSALALAQSTINRIWHATRRDQLEARASKAGRLISLSFVNRAVWTPRRYDKLAEESYAKNAVAFRAINEISKCAGSVPFLLFRGTGKERVEILDGPLLDLLRRPNPMQGRAAFIQSLVGFYLIAGNSYIESVGVKTKPPTELWTKRPDRMMVKAGKFGLPAAYIYTVGGQSVEWTVISANRQVRRPVILGDSSILHLKAFNPLNDWYGQSPVEAAAFSIDQHNEAGKWNMARLQNDARPSGALVVDPKSGTGLDDVQYERLKEEIRSHSGPNAAGTPLLLEGGLDWKEMGLSAVDQDWLNGKHTSARDIAMVFGMPAQMLGIPGDNTHRNMEEARLWLWEQTVMPLMDFILGELNDWLTPRFGEGLELMFDMDEVPALISRRHMLWDKINKTDFLRVDEKRKATGYEPLPDGKGDVVLVPVNKAELGEEGEKVVANPINMKKKPNGKDDGKNALAK